MGLTIWLSVLCLQASLLSHALDCSGASQGERCVSGPIADGQYDDVKQQRALPSTGVSSKEMPLPFRRKRQLERRGPTHLSHTSLPGAVSVKGSPNTLIQTDRSRRHLVQAGSKKKNKRKPRVGSFSLLSHNNPSAPLQVTRARRQVKNEPVQKGKSNRSGAYSILGDSQNEGQNDRPRRSAQRNKAAKRNIYT